MNKPLHIMEPSVQDKIDSKHKSVETQPESTVDNLNNRASLNSISPLNDPEETMEEDNDGLGCKLLPLRVPIALNNIESEHEPVATQPESTDKVKENHLNKINEEVDVYSLNDPDKTWKEHSVDLESKPSHIKVTIEMDKTDSKHESVATHDKGEENHLNKREAKYDISPQETREEKNYEFRSKPLQPIAQYSQNEPIAYQPETTYKVKVKENQLNKNNAEENISPLHGLKEINEENNVDLGCKLLPSMSPIELGNIDSKHESVATNPVSFDKGEENFLNKRDAKYDISPLDDTGVNNVDLESKPLQLKVPIEQKKIDSKHEPAATQPDSTYEFDENALNKKDAEYIISPINDPEETRNEVDVNLGYKYLQIKLTDKVEEKSWNTTDIEDDHEETREENNVEKCVFNIRDTEDDISHATGFEETGKGDNDDLCSKPLHIGVPFELKKIESKQEHVEIQADSSDVELCFIQASVAFVLKKLDLPETWAITLTILTVIIINLLDGCGDVGLAFSLFWKGETGGSITLFSIDYLAVFLTVIHFGMTVTALNISCTIVTFECLLLIFFHPIAPSLTLIFWIISRQKDNETLSDHFHFLSKLIITITGTFEAPLQVIATTWLSLTGKIPTPWTTNKKFCDQYDNCLDMGGFFTVFVYLLSWMALLKASIEAFQVGNKLTLVAFLLPTILFRLSCFIGLVTYSTVWSLFFLLPLLIANMCVVSCHRNRSQAGIHFWTTVLCSTFVTTVIPEDPSKKEKTGQTSINQDSAVSMASMMSILNLPIIFIATIIIYCVVQYNPNFNVDTDIKLDSKQLTFLFCFFIIPLFILSMLVTIWFYLTQTEQTTKKKIPMIIKNKFVQLGVNILLLAIFSSLIISNAVLYPPTKLPADSSNTKALNATFTPAFNPSTTANTTTTSTTTSTTTTTTTATSIEAGTRCTGGDSCCSGTVLCGYGSGDCDGDNQCAGNLKCGTDNCKMFTGNGLSFDLTDDCCYDPAEPEKAERGTDTTQEGYCTSHWRGWGCVDLHNNCGSGFSSTFSYENFVCCCICCNESDETNCGGKRC